MRYDKNGSGLAWIGLGLAVGGAFVAVGIGLDDTHLSDYQLQVWDLVAKSLGGFAIFGGAFRYLNERRAQLAWEKTRFIIDLFSDFDRSEQYQRARRLVDEATDSRDDSYLGYVLGPIAALSEETHNDRDCLDRYLDFFDRLYTYVFITKTLSPNDVASFWGYVVDIAKRPPLRSFALKWGYEDVLRLAESFEVAAQKRNRVIDALEEEPPLAEDGTSGQGGSNGIG